MKEKKIMLVTGTSRGIGRYLVEHYLERGYMIIGCSRHESNIESDCYRHFCLDIKNEKEVVTMFNDIRRKYRRLDILINNAGTASFNHSILTPYSTIEEVFKTNTFGTFLFCREAAKIMSKRKYGRIVNFTSGAVPLKLEGESAYAASKAAIDKLTQIFAKEFAPFDITCNAIGPAVIGTDMLQIFPKEAIEKVINLQAIKRTGKYIDIANVIDFFIKDESSFITGQTVYLGGVML